jgi:hypothetical protein
MHIGNEIKAVAGYERDPSSNSTSTAKDTREETKHAIHPVGESSTSFGMLVVGLFQVLV